MAASQREFAVPVAPSPVLAQALAAYPHLAQSSPRTPEQPFPRNARSSSSKRAAVAERVSSKRLKKVERRVLPARIGTSTISSVSNELDDMVMECFSKACKSWNEQSTTFLSGA
ncbi:hypothetical protein QFC19_004743 [Naganishia cerealis]|uniref:Uncharacterized protein n=1 Tax=Naganishia cerealis TaxID=610337 RepID=A0ACC2VU84_9TREE|nr:hypothetical protein QFC19_004743 [Naganishia cerealis]